MPETKNQVIPLRSLDEMVLLVHKKFDHVVSAQQKFFSARVECGMLLLELRKRIESGEDGANVKWWDWYESRFARSRRDAERVMELARAEDPQAAYEQKKVDHAEDMRERRAAAAAPTHSESQNYPEESTKRGEAAKRPALSLVEPPPEPEVQHDLIDRAIAVVKLMNITTRHRFVVKLRQVYRD